jgi:hypothetical protein
MIVRQEFCRLIHKAMILIVNSRCTEQRPDLYRVQVKFSDSAPGRGRPSLTTKPQSWFPGLRGSCGKLSYWPTRCARHRVKTIKLMDASIRAGQYYGEYQCSGRNRSSWCTHRRSALSASLCLCQLRPASHAKPKTRLKTAATSCNRHHLLMPMSPRQSQWPIGAASAGSRRMQAARTATRVRAPTRWRMTRR